ncbi:unnamed protein product [Gongylonema pulchrum]|uniref:Uncharacterized protein n=1 Tax=Gongylonema pulchrum TaxID=637853 RepID=A0A183DDR1_9BILA|nr:unnamed protein product [Gongylonema pulchrum]
MLEADVHWNDAFDWEATAQPRALFSADGISSTSAAIVTFSQSHAPAVNNPAMTPTASTESSSLQMLPIE